MGAIYAGGLLLGAALTAVSGPVSDRLGRRPFLIGYDITQILAGLTALATAAPALLIPAAVIGGFGRGANGFAGPFGPVEQSWLARELDEREFGVVYSLNAAVGSAGMAAGALLAALPALWRGALPGALAYRPLFGLVLAGSLGTLALLLSMRDTPDAPAPDAAPADAAPANAAPANAGPAGAAPRHDRRRENGSLARLVGINALNGLAIGIVGPFMAYWFHLRFAVGASAIGPVIALGFLLSSVASLWTGRLARRFGTVRSVVAMRVVGLVLFLLLPFSPSYGVASALYALRAACNRGTAGARQAVGLRLVAPRRRGLAASLNTISMQVPRALGPVLGGVLLDAGLLALPLLLAAALQGGYVALYARAFGWQDRQDRGG